MRHFRGFTDAGDGRTGTDTPHPTATLIAGHPHFCADRKTAYRGRIRHSHPPDSGLAFKRQLLGSGIDSRNRKIRQKKQNRQTHGERVKKILIAEDNPVNMELMREILGTSRYEIIEVENGHQALAKIEELSPSLVLLDINMPGMDGFAVIHNLRKDPRFLKLPVIALTAYAMKDDRNKMIAAGFDSYISKPIDALLLVKEIERLILCTFQK